MRYLNNKISAVNDKDAIPINKISCPWESEIKKAIKPCDSLPLRKSISRRL